MNLGTVSGGRSWRADVRLVHEAVDRGVVVFDTADAYGNGASERIIGRALGARRDRVEIATKGGYLFRERSRPEVAARQAAKALRDRLRPPATSGGTGGGGGGGGRSQDVSAAHLRTALEASLRRLRTDHVDVYQVHGPRHVLPALLDELQDLVATGKVGRFGVGAESLDAAAAWSTVAGIDVVQMPVGVLDPEGVDVVEAVAANGAEVWARGVFAGGVLAAADRDPVAATRDPKWPLIAGLRDVAARHDIDTFALALGFVRAIPAVSTVLLGMSTSDHLTRNLALFAAPPLAPEVLDEVWSVVRRRDDDPAGRA